MLQFMTKKISICYFAVIPLTEKFLLRKVLFLHHIFPLTQVTSKKIVPIKKKSFSDSVFHILSHEVKCLLGNNQINHNSWKGRTGPESDLFSWVPFFRSVGPFGNVWHTFWNKIQLQLLYTISKCRSQCSTPLIPANSFVNLIFLQSPWFFSSLNPHYHA